MRVRIAAALFVALCARAQAPTGAIEGTVVDPGGAVVPAAKVTVTELATARAVPLTTNELGRYSARNLLPGTYTVRVEAPGFSAAEISGVAVNAGSVVQAGATLQLGLVEEVVTVSGAAVAVDAARQTVDTIISEQEIRNIPLFTRNFLDLAALAPGVTVRDWGAALPFAPGDTVAYRVVGIAGRSGVGTRVQIDGIDVTGLANGSTTANISSDAVHEFQLSRSSLDVSAPMTSSGAISIISKSGGNQVHGTGFWDHYNQDMGARLEYNASSEPFRRNRAGLSAGGPFVKDGLFWYAGWERAYQREQSVSSVPEFPQLSISQSFPVGIRYARGRLDWNLKPALRLFYSFQHDWNFVTLSAATSPLQLVNWNNTHTAALDLTRQRSTHSYRFGYVNLNRRRMSEELDLKFPRTPQGIPYFLSVGSFRLGPSTLGRESSVETFQQHSYDGSLLHGRHTLRYGAGVQRTVFAGVARINETLAVTGVFNAGVVAQIRARGGNLQDPLEYPLQGASTGSHEGYNFLAAGRSYPHGAHFGTRTSAWLADSFRWNRRLTLNFGLRWQYDSGYFPNDRRVKRDPALERLVRGGSEFPVLPKDLFSPSFGFAFDPVGSGKTVIRGGFYQAYESNIISNFILDERSMLPVGIGPVGVGLTSARGPNGAPISVDGRHPNGDYSDLLGRPVKDVIGLIGLLHQTVQAAYSSLPFDPAAPSEFAVTRTGTLIPGTQFKIPYALQFNIGFQRQLKPGTVLSADYVENRGVGLPLLPIDYERRRDAGTLDAAAARSQINRVVGARSVDQWMAANPSATIGALGLASDAVWPGLTPDLLRVRFVTGGFSRYRGLQFQLRGSRAALRIFKDPSYLVSYALARSQATGTFPLGHSEFAFSGGWDNRRWTSKEQFGPNGLDFTHILSVASLLGTPGGFRLSSRWTFRTAAPQNLYMPNPGGAISGEQGLFGVDLNGDGVADQLSARVDVLPGVNAGQFGRRVKSFRDLNRILGEFNQNFAGRLTPHGQALVAAGLLTEAQLRRLGAVIPSIPLVPETNPAPRHNLLITDLRLDRPIKLERFQISPFADFINLFNHAPAGIYGTLGATFGTLNFDYANAPPGRQASDLDRQRRRLNAPRKIQIGVRFDF